MAPTDIVAMESASKTERLGLRVSARQKALIQRAADLTGRSVTDFLLSAAQSVAEETIREYEVLRISDEDTEAFFAALENPPKLDERMREAFRWNRENVEERW